MKIVLFDCETTGFPKLPIETQPVDVQPRIIQIAAHLIEYEDLTVNFTILDSLVSYVNPHSPVPDKITEITGITDKDVVNAPDWVDVGSKFFDMCKVAGAVCSHNFQFDARMVQIEEKALGRPKPFADMITRCTLLASRKINTRAPSHSLGNLYKYLFGTEMSGAHTADGDTNALIRIYMDMVEKGFWSRR